MDKLYPTFAMENGLRSEDLSRDEKIVNDYISDPLVHPMVTAKTGIVIINRGIWIMENASINANETLIMFGDCENIVNPQPIIEYSQIAPHITLKIWPDCFHEIHNEPEKETIYNFTSNWMKEHSQNSK